MAEEKKNSKLGGIILGPLFICVSIVGLWKNENRFNYHKAAKATEPVAAASSLSDGQIFSFTGGMDQSLTFPGEYVRFFTGYLDVERRAEIYAWKKSTDSDNNVKWSKMWMTSLESNSRNNGISQRFQSGFFGPEQYSVDDLTIQADRIEFVDSREYLAPSSLELVPSDLTQGLAKQDRYLYLSKSGGDRLGDERIAYRGIPVPVTATYFGKSENGVAVAHQAAQKSGIMSEIIQDTGVVHHLVAGQREEALHTMKSHFQKVKNIVRGIGLGVNILGWATLFSVFSGFFYHVPIIGPMVSRMAMLMAVAFGVVFGGGTIVLGFLTHHIWVVLPLIAIPVAGILYLRANARKSQTTVHHQVSQSIGHQPSSAELKELEFYELVQLSMDDGQISPAELELLREYASDQGWPDAHASKLFDQAMSASTGLLTKRDHMKNLVRFALADGIIDQRERKVLNKASAIAGVGTHDLGRLIQEAQSGAVG